MMRRVLSIAACARIKFAVAAGAALAVGSAPCTLPGQTPAPATSKSATLGYRNRLLGVYDEASGEPLEGVRVTDVLNQNSAQTTRTGTVALNFLPDGGGLVRLTKVGYETQTVPISISPADTTPVTLIMRHIAELPAVVTKADSERRWISPALRGFDERRRIRITGYFIADSVLRSDEGRPLANVLARVPSVITKNGVGTATYLLKSPRCDAGGPPQVYLDGVPLNPDMNPDVRGLMKQPQKSALGQPIRGSGPENNIDNVPFDLTRFQVSDLAGVEWYPDNDLIPAEFAQSTRRCGALLLWTREK